MHRHSCTETINTTDDEDGENDANDSPNIVITFIIHKKVNVQ